MKCFDVKKEPAVAIASQVGEMFHVKCEKMQASKGQVVAKEVRLQMDTYYLPQKLREN